MPEHDVSLTLPPPLTLVFVRDNDLIFIFVETQLENGAKMIFPRDFGRVDFCEICIAMMI